MSTNLLILLSVVEAVVLIAVVALIEINRRLVTISDGLATLASALVTVEAQHLRPLAGLLTAVNERVATLLTLLPGIRDKAQIVVDHAPGQ